MVDNNALMGLVKTAWGCPIGTPGFTLNTGFGSPFNGSVMDMTAQNLTGEVTCKLMTLTYLNEIWQGTVASQLAYTIDPIWQQQSGKLQQYYTDQEILASIIDVTDLGTPSAGTAGTPPIFNLGYVQYVYPSGAGRLMQLRLQSQQFIPDVRGAQGVNIFLKPGVVVNVENRLRPYQQLPGGNYFGQPCSYLGAQLGMFSLNSPLGSDDNFSSTTLPVRTQAVLGTATELSNNTTWSDTFFEDVLIPADCSTDWRFILAYCAEIHESVLIKEIGTSSSGAIPITGSNSKRLPTSLMKSANITITNQDDLSDWVFGPSGPKYYGMYAPVYPFGIGEIQYLNSNSNAVIPRQPCVGVQWWLKPGVTATLTYQATIGLAWGTYWDGKRISLADGVVDGIL